VVLHIVVAPLPGETAVASGSIANPRMGGVAKTIVVLLDERGQRASDDPTTT
jgi:hypothetical protein